MQHKRCENRTFRLFLYDTIYIFRNLAVEKKMLDELLKTVRLTFL